LIVLFFIEYETLPVVFTLSESLESPDLGDFPSGESPVFGNLPQVYFERFVWKIDGFDGKRASPQSSPVERGHSHPDGVSVSELGASSLRER
jgi:hypothetical protein